jgi:hypothetical protein
MLTSPSTAFDDVLTRASLEMATAAPGSNPIHEPFVRKYRSATAPASCITVHGVQLVGSRVAQRIGVDRDRRDVEPLPVEHVAVGVEGRDTPGGARMSSAMKNMLAT